MQIIHDSSAKKPMQVVDDGKEEKLKAFDAEEALDVPDDKDAGMIIGALLGHTRSIFEYISEHTGMTSKEVLQGYGYYFYSNVLTDLEDMFCATTELMDEVDMLEDMIGDEDDKD